MARQVQVTVHLPAPLLKQIEDLMLEEQRAGVQSGIRTDISRNGWIVMLIERGLAAEPKAPELRADVGDIVP